MTSQITRVTALDRATPDYLSPVGCTHTRHVADLTDEEVLGIDGPGAELVAPLPWLGGRAEPETTLAAEVGLRGLVAHGSIAAHEDGLELPTDLEAALSMRHDSRAIVYADHSTPDLQETRILYVHADGVLVEAVNAAGIHRFSVGDLDGALGELAEWCVPSHHEGDATLEGDDFPRELAGLQSVVFVDVVALAPGGDVDTTSLTFYRLSDGRVAEGIEVAGRLDLPECDPDGIRRQLERTVRHAVDLA